MAMEMVITLALLILVVQLGKLNIVKKFLIADSALLITKLVGAGLGLMEHGVVLAKVAKSGGNTFSKQVLGNASTCCQTKQQHKPIQAISNRWKGTKSISISFYLLRHVLP